MYIIHGIPLNILEKENSLEGVMPEKDLKI